MKYLINLFFFSFFFINFSVFSLEITVPISFLDNLSKNSKTSIIGSSSIIIDKKKLENKHSLPIHSILDFEKGIKSRSIYGSNFSGSKTTIDMRGMGAQAKSNVLILINGQRLNNIDMSEIDFPSIPIESIDKIEIF